MNNKDWMRFIHFLNELQEQYDQMLRLTKTVEKILQFRNDLESRVIEPLKLTSFEVSDIPGVAAVASDDETDDVEKIAEASTAEEVNALLAEGWKLLKLKQNQDDVYILGLPRNIVRWSDLE